MHRGPGPVTNTGRNVTALEMPPEATPRGSQSQERLAQEERERSALVVLYSTPAQIPDSPAEPSSQIPEEQVDEGVVMMLTGPDVDAVFWSGGAPAIVDTVRPSASVAELVGQLAAAAPDVMMGDAAQAAAAMPSLYPTFSGINPEQLQQLVQHAQALTQSGTFSGVGPSGTAPSQAQPGDASQGWGPGNQYSEYDRGYHENGVGRGGGGGGDPSRRWNEDGWGSGSGPGGDRGGPFRGRGPGRGGPPMRGMGRGRGDGYRSTKRKPCSFFQAGRRALEFAPDVRNGKADHISLPSLCPQMPIWRSVRLQPRAAPVLTALDPYGRTRARVYIILMPFYSLHARMATMRCTLSRDRRPATLRSAWNVRCAFRG